MHKTWFNIFQARRSILNISSTHFVTLCSIACSIILTPFILHRLGSEQYGIWVILNSLMTYFSFSKLGFSTKMLKDLAEQGGGDEERIINSFFFSLLLIQLIFLPLLVSAGYWLRFFVRADDPVFFSRVVLSFILLYLGFVLSLAANVFNTVFYSRNQYLLVNVLVSVRTLLNLALVVLTGWMGRIDILALAVISVFVAALYAGYLYIRSQSVVSYRIHFRYFDRAYMRQALVPSLQYFMLAIGSLVIYQSDTLVISYFLGAGAVTAYALGYRLVEIPQRMIRSVADVLFPKLAHLYANHHQQDFSLLFRKIFVVVLPLNGVLTGVLYFAGGRILSLWVGPEYVVARSVLNIFIITFFVQTVAHTYGVIIKALGWQRELTVMMMLEAALNLALSVYLVRRIGLVGVALGTMISHFCVTGWYAPYFVHARLRTERKGGNGP